MAMIRVCSSALNILEIFICMILQFSDAISKQPIRRDQSGRFPPHIAALCVTALFVSICSILSNNSILTLWAVFSILSLNNRTLSLMFAAFGNASAISLVVYFPGYIQYDTAICITLIVSLFMHSAFIIVHHYMQRIDV